MRCARPYFGGGKNPRLAGSDPTLRGSLPANFTRLPHLSGSSVSSGFCRRSHKRARTNFPNFLGGDSPCPY